MARVFNINFCLNCFFIHAQNEEGEAMFRTSLRLEGDMMMIMNGYISLYLFKLGKYVLSEMISSRISSKIG